MNEFHCVTVCAALAVILVAVILVALTINPWVALGPAPRRRRPVKGEGSAERSRCGPR